MSNSHTHTSIHLAINMASNIPNHTSIMLTNKAYHTSNHVSSNIHHITNPNHTSKHASSQIILHPSIP